jgi:hypothetical protein
MKKRAQAECCAGGESWVWPVSWEKRLSQVAEKLFKDCEKCQGTTLVVP